MTTEEGGAGGSPNSPSAPNPPEPIHGDGGVKWLFSGLLLRKLVDIAKSTLANELDIRDWMAPNAAPDYRDGRDELWFDFMADTGDDPYVMKQLARGANTPFAAGALRRAPDEHLPILDHPALPVGAFLLLGGDTAYVTPDETTLRYRFVAPFNAAYREAAAETGAAPQPRPIYAIPGNHDYYDGLVGFNRIFRTPYRDPDSKTVLPIDGYTPNQEATYLRILMPGEWELWAADIGPHGLDYRQRKYFVPGGGPPPNKLVLCTHAPAISSDRLDLSPADHKAFAELLQDDDPAFTSATGGHQPPDGACRLFLAGHVHHYARYDGQPDGGHAPVPVATVVAGAGGSFVHPTEHRRGDIPAAAKYPDVARSREMTSTAVTSPFKVMSGGYLWVIALVMSAVLYGVWPERHTIPWPLTPSAIGAIAWTATVLGGIGLLGGGIKLSMWFGKRRQLAARAARPHGHIRTHRNGRRLENLVIPVFTALALGLPFITRRFVREMDPMAPEAVWLVLVTAIVIGIALVGYVAGGVPHPRLFGTFGAIHGVLQIAFPYLIASRGWPYVGGAFVVWFLLGYVGRWLYIRQAAVLMIFWWLVQGVGVAVALYLIPVEWCEPRLDLWALAALTGAFSVPLQFGHYLLLASAWDGHCNEAGITARSTSFKQWIRFHVTKDALTGYVIGLDRPNASPKLVDVFTIQPRPSVPAK